jgi:hypothetical protein
MLPKVSMHELYSFEYRMHAYQDGNFKDIKTFRKLTWAQLLNVLGSSFVSPTPEEYFSKRMNEYLNETGLKMHVKRCQEHTPFQEHRSIYVLCMR